MKIKETQSYSITQHRHRFAVWSSARASQRGFKATTSNIEQAIDNAGIASDVQNLSERRIEADEYDSLHRKWCNSLINTLSGLGVQNVAYGRAAKIIAIYLKVMVIIPSDGNTPLASVAHPPIDRILIENISRKDSKLKLDNNLDKVNWTQLSEKDYFLVVNALKEFLPQNSPFWKIEFMWKATNDEL